jgi:hypothetical protein
MNKECTHNEYYGQFVTDSIIRSVKSFIGEDRIRNSTDPHFNDIPLHLWDRLSDSMKSQLTIFDEYEDGKKYYSLCSGVCTLKQAARMIKESM